MELHGQWFGFYEYGEHYPEEVTGEKVIFSIHIEKLADNKFSGKCIELTGTHLIEEISFIEGFVEDNFISFQKNYKGKYGFDEEGRPVQPEDDFLHELNYEGQYDAVSGCFTGEWEIWQNDRLPGDLNYILTGAGYWEMSKDAARYGI